MRPMSHAGFSVIELMTTVAVAGVVLALAVPSFISTVNQSRLSGAANELAAALQYARSEAIKRNASVELCESGDESSCGSGSGAWRGWIVVANDANGDGSGGDALVLQSFRIKPPVQVRRAAGADKVIYRADGFARSAGAARGALLNTSFSVCIPTAYPKDNVRRVRLASGGRIATDAFSSDGVCS